MDPFISSIVHVLLSKHFQQSQTGFSIQIDYGDYKARWHGGEGGELHKIRLYNGDKITRVSGRRGIGIGAGIDQLTFYGSR